MVYDSINQSKAMSRSFYLLAAREKLQAKLFANCFILASAYFLTSTVLDGKHEKNRRKNQDFFQFVSKSFKQR